MVKKWISKAIKNKGGLHKALKIPMSKNIPVKKLNSAKGGKLAKMVNLAKTLKGFKK